jgi:dihydrofolate reductase
MQVSVFCGVSVDGFLARPNDDIDFLDAGGQEPHGYEEFFASVDALCIGRRTYEKVLSFGGWAYGPKRVVVLSSRPLDFSSIKGGNVGQMSGPPAVVAFQLAASGIKHLYLDGGVTIQGFLREGLVHRLIVTRAGADRQRHSLVWRASARRDAGTCRDPHLPRRPGAKRISGGREQIDGRWRL